MTTTSRSPPRAEDGMPTRQIFETLAVDDIRAACDLFRPIYDASEGGDGFVSIEVEPDLARDADGTRVQVRRLWDAIGRPNLMVKIPGTVEGAPVIEEMLTEGKNINVTLLFSIEAYERVATAFLNALEARGRKSLTVDRIASVASFFVSRVDTAVDREIDVLLETARDKRPTRSPRRPERKSRGRQCPAGLRVLPEPLWNAQRFAD